MRALQRRASALAAARLTTSQWITTRTKELCEREACGSVPVSEYANYDATSKISFEGVMGYTCDFDYTKPREGEVPHKERMTDECLDGCQEGCTVVGNAWFEVFGGVDTFDVTLYTGKPVSFGEPILVGNTAVDTRAYLFPESTSAVCDMDDTTTGVASRDTTFTSSCQENGTFISPKSCEAVSCGVSEEDHGTAPAIVSRQQGYPMRSGDVRGAASYALACTAAGSSSFTSESCGFMDPMQTHDSVSDRQSYSGNLGCAGVGGCFGRTFSCRDADLSLTGGGSQNNDNLYQPSAVYFIVNHDLLTPFDPGCVARTREIRFTATGWHDGCALDTIVPDVEDEDNAISDNL